MHVNLVSPVNNWRRMLGEQRRLRTVRSGDWKGTGSWGRRRRREMSNLWKTRGSHGRLQLSWAEGGMF